ncbi:M20/M25/M40 family metallo-hydrolase [Pontibacter harenae]|uniref:M20/M25/M40 family metallo-hydrolase n=1 Tax=Pontibacter harenae TaxID=2894083 RepID=UPI001E35AB4E|nr:M20/M25/M40 family metallo-hydrolase [Pontibacter harenae]MCC9166088.1 M20/M25/M40 family metallo-hydrolase [Pontibacter harenae]
MKQYKLWAVALALGFSSTAVAQKVTSITEKETTRLIKTLSADDMQGRSTFTPGIDKAADFIAQEFKRIGLKPLPGNAHYEQEFTVFRVKPGKVQAQLNSKTISPENAFASTSQAQLNWQADKQRQIVTIKEGANLRDELMKAQSLQEEALVLVHPSHEQAFKNFQRYFTRSSVKTDLGKEASKVYLLTDQFTPGSYTINLSSNVEQLPLANVGGMIEGKRTDEYVVFSGHYDHIGIGKAVDGDSIANGADDDASGTAAMMMLADYYKKQGKPERSLLFVAFTAEEIGGYGSKYFSEQLDPNQIVAMFNIEMVGKPSKFGPNSAYLTGFERSDMGQLMQKSLEGTSYSIHPDPYPEQNLFYRSDNATLARLGVPAHTISSVQIDQDKTYHTVKDEFEMLNMPHLTNMIRAIALASQSIVNGTATPSRVDKSQVRQ